MNLEEDQLSQVSLGELESVSALSALSQNEEAQIEEKQDERIKSKVL